MEYLKDLAKLHTILRNKVENEGIWTLILKEAMKVWIDLSDRSPGPQSHSDITVTLLESFSQQCKSPKRAEI